MASAWIEPREGKKGKSYRVGWRDHARKRRYSKPFTRKTDAVNFKRNLEHSLGAGTYLDPTEGKITLEEFFHHFMANPPVATGPKPSTRALYETHARLYIVPGLGDRPLNSIRRQDVSTFLAGLERPRGGVVGPSTKEHVYRQLRRLLNYAVLEGRIAANPARGITVEKAEPRGPRFMSAEEVEALGQVHPVRYRALILLACWMGPRFGELSALRIKHLDYLRRPVNILGAASHVGGKRYEGSTKSRRTRSIPVPPDVDHAHLKLPSSAH
jgi:integrase